ncbi:DUF6455 family protein [Microvirga massiliensis]|uniref:DUF6455 family protein n=1 Tax=Microvirga massiliensis TaxID=1033741 RepID=UPI00065F89C8|nr:DUF6455 family protein [Microvirga massiliensis]
MIEAGLLANALGAGGVASAIVWGLLRNRRAILIGQGAQAICFGAHFAVIGAYTGAAMCALSLVQLGAAAAARSRVAMLAFWGTAPAIILLAGWSWHGVASAGAALGLALATVGRWQQDPLALRWYFVSSTLGWASHNLLVASPFGLATDVMALSTNGWRIWQERAGEKTMTMRRWMRDRVERQARLMGDMMERLSVDPVAAMLRDRAFATATRRCLWCSASEQCRQWLSEGASPDRAEPDFCVNAPLFLELRSGTGLAAGPSAP